MFTATYYPLGVVTHHCTACGRYFFGPDARCCNRPVSAFDRQLVSSGIDSVEAERRYQEHRARSIKKASKKMLSARIRWAPGGV